MFSALGCDVIGGLVRAAAEEELLHFGFEQPAFNDRFLFGVTRYVKSFESEDEAIAYLGRAF